VILLEKDLVASLIGNDWVSRVAPSDGVATVALEVGHANGSVDVGVVNLGGVADVVVDDLCGVVVLSFLSLALDNWLDLLNDVLVDVLVDLRCVDGGAVSLLTSGLDVFELRLLLVLGGGGVVNVLVAIAADLWSDVLVVGVVLLVVYDGLNLLVDLGLVTLAVDDWGDLVVRVAADVLLSDSILDVASVSPANAVVNLVLGWLAIGEGLGAAGVLLVVVLVHVLSLLLVVQGTHELVDDRHCCELWLVVVGRCEC